MKTQLSPYLILYQNITRLMQDEEQRKKYEAWRQKNDLRTITKSK